MHSLPRWLVLVSLILVSLLPGKQTRAAAPFPPLLVLGDSLGEYPLVRHLALLEDPAGTLALDQVLRNLHQFQLTRKAVPTYGATASAVWAAFRVHNPTRADWYLEIGVPYIPQVDVYRQTTAGSFVKQAVGDREPYSRRPVRTNQLIIPLQVPAGGYGTYYLRLQSDHTLGFPLRIATLQTLYESNQRLDLLNGMYFGLLLALMVYNLFVYLSLGDRAYLYYVLCVLLAAVNIAYQRGYAFQLLWPDRAALNSPMLFASVATICVVLFTDAFLDTARYMPRLRWLHWSLAGLAGLILILTLAGFRQEAFRLQSVASLLMVMYVVTFGAGVYRQGFRPARYYLLGFGCLYTGIAIFILKDVHLLPFNTLTQSSFQAGSALEAIVLSYALVDKFNRYRKEKELAQVQALRQATAFTGQLLSAQEQERKRIAAELHDSVGQSLGLIKNRLLLLGHGTQPVTPASLTQVARSVGDSLEEVRTISYGLRPVQLDLWGLSRAVRALVEDTASASHLELSQEVEDVEGLFTKEAEINLYRIVQESLHNMVRHAQATKGLVRLHRQTNQVILWIEDNGKGITGQAGRGGAGLVGFAERVSLLGGSLSVREAAPKGTIIHIVVPVAQSV
jgi:signal transduction histidine kinase